LLNLNIFYDPNYWLKQRRLFNRYLSQSSISNPYYRSFYNSNKPINDNLIKSGPQKLVNNIIKAFNTMDSVEFNKHKYNNYYFCNFDSDLYNLILQTIEEKNNKVIVGPLYTNDDFLKLVELAKYKNNLKIVAASSTAKTTMLKVAKGEISPEKIVILPVGIDSQKNIKNLINKESENNNECLIYFKGRSESDLTYVLNYLNETKIKYKVFRNGKYKNSELIDYANKSNYGIIIGRTESQGIAINEMMSVNLPLLVFDSTNNYYEGEIFEGTTVPYWNEICGMKILKLNYIDRYFNKFTQNVIDGEYQPYKFVLDNLSFEVMHMNLKKIFEDF